LCKQSALLAGLRSFSLAQAASGESSRLLATALTKPNTTALLSALALHIKAA